MSTFDGLIEALLAEIRVPALLKALSEGVDVAGVQRICFATFARRGNWKECSLYQPQYTCTGYDRIKRKIHP